MGEGERWGRGGGAHAGRVKTGPSRPCRWLPRDHAGLRLGCQARVDTPFDTHVGGSQWDQHEGGDLPTMGQRPPVEAAGRVCV